MNTDELGKILITGTGRCGTTFLMRLFTLLNLDTGYSSNNINNSIFSNCNSGMEKEWNAKHRIIKNPRFAVTLNVFKQNNVKIDYIIMPIRNLDDAAQSRVNHGNHAGGLIYNSRDKNEQIQCYYKMISEVICYTILNDTPLILLNFDKMTTDDSYLYDKLLPVLDNISYEDFQNAYDKATNLSKPKNKN